MNHNWKPSLSIISAIVFLLGVNKQTRAIEYVAIDLTPVGFNESFANSICNGQQAGSGASAPTGGYLHALIWNGSATNFTDVNPSEFQTSFSEITSIYGSQQVGDASVTGSYGSAYHAILWNGTASSAIDLNPNGFSSSFAYGISGDQQVGYAYNSVDHTDHAFLWNGSAASAIDLNPSGFSEANANGTNGIQQVGSGFGTTARHALLWSGTAASCIDLNPSGYVQSEAYGIGGTQQVGWGLISITNFHHHALLWNGTSASYKDLNPSGFDYSEAKSTNGFQQVGYAGNGSNEPLTGHAILWSGSATSAIDLQQFLPSNFIYSEANAIDSQGNIVGNALDNTRRTHAILWQPVPEPATFVMLGIGALSLGFFWRRKRAG